MDDKHGELLDGLDWYWSRKVEAYRGFASLNASNFAANARQYYGEYFLYLVSAIEILNDFDNSFNDYMVATLDGYGGHSGTNNFQYLRLLRHAMIHRGANLTSVGVDVNGTTCPLAPPILTARGGKSFSRFSPFLTVIIFFCEAKIGPAIEGFMTRKHLWDRDPAKSLEVALQMVRSMEHCSEKNKKHIEKIMNEQAANGGLPFNTFQELRDSLKSGVSTENDVQGLLSESEAWWAHYRSHL